VPDPVLFENRMGWTKVVTGTGKYVVLVRVRVTRGLDVDGVTGKLGDKTCVREEEQGTSGRAPPRRHAVAVSKEEGASTVAELNSSMLVLEGTGILVEVALAIPSVVDGNAVPDAASRLANSASCWCKRSSIALRNSRTSCGRSDKPSEIDVTASVSSAASISGVELGSFCIEIVVASRRMASCL
jgi:hypothetical protein